MSSKDCDEVIQSARLLIRTLRINEKILNNGNEAVSVPKRYKHAKIKTDKNCIQDIMKSFNGTINTSTDDEVDDDYGEITQFMKNNISYPKPTPILTLWKNYMIVYLRQVV